MPIRQHYFTTRKEVQIPRAASIPTKVVPKIPLPGFMNWEAALVVEVGVEPPEPVVKEVPLVAEVATASGPLVVLVEKPEVFDGGKVYIYVVVVNEQD